VVDRIQKKKSTQREERQPKYPNLHYKMYTFRLSPTVKQVCTLEWTLRRCAELYNACLEERTAAYQMCGISVSYDMQSAQLPELKVLRPEYREIHSQVLQDVLKRLEKAMQAFFRVPKDLSMRWHSCPECGMELDRDENAAKNILKRYHEHKELASEKKKKTPRTSKKAMTLTGAGSVPQGARPTWRDAHPVEAPSFSCGVLHILRFKFQ
jgi:transposase